MTNEQIISKMKDDMKMRGFSHWTEESYLGKTKDIMKYFRKPMEEVEIEELRNFLLKHLREERKLSERSVNYYNSVIRFMYEVTMDKIINKKQLPMYRVCLQRLPIFIVSPFPKVTNNFFIFKNTP